MTIAYHCPPGASDATGRANLSTKERMLALAVRQALLIALGALEDYLGLPRSAPPKR